MAKTKTDAERLAEIRERIGALHDELHDLERRPVSRDEALAAVDRWIEKRASELTSDFLISNLLSGEAHTRLTPIKAGETDWAPTLCAIQPQAVRDFLIAQIDQALAEREPLSTEERNSRRGEVRQELWKLEAEEESIVARKEAAGEAVARRGDADVRAVLGLSEPPKRPAPPERDADPAVVNHTLPRQSRSGDGFENAVDRTRGGAADNSPDA